ncbi:type IV pilin [Haloferax sp. MBLA0076]|uniref:Type IV pilin n=1 Tax=Haloferax litoreum TaxID=2666140 RepID=A0A6A8GFW1_9EURY|nr:MULTISPECIES: type IV pilin N-terminal domain-containing protein [Haloferax]KAB1193538.1 type IV pilin [Haloferax sp. CBA1148]MRX22053.1 type IV pilin [Haloferax litoreum]
MNFKDLLTDDDAVSPVIGVILMVAITVILAAVIGTFVLGLGDQVSETAPQASFSFDFQDTDGGQDVFTVTHESGESIVASSISLKSNQNYSVTNAPNNNGTSNAFTEWGYAADDKISAGTSIKAYNTTSDKDLSDQTFSIVWTSESGSNSATLQKWSGPDA